MARETSFTWKRVKKASSYRVKICSDPVCNTVKFSTEQSANSLKKEFEPGIYYFTLAPVSATGKLGFWSEARKFIVKPATPALSSPAKEEKIIIEEVKPISFEWKKARGTGFYVIEIKLNKEKARYHKTRKNSLSVKGLMPGSYTWRVKSVLNKNITEGYSTAQKFTIEKKPPHITDPENDSKITLISNKLKIKWDGTGFASYILKISFAPDEKSPFRSILKKVVRKNSYELSPMEFGKYRVELSGVFKNKKIPARAVIFNSVKRLSHKNNFYFYLIAGDPISSETDYPYTTATEESPGELTLFGAGYKRLFDHLSFSLDSCISEISKPINIFIFKSKAGYDFHFKRIILSPAGGIHFFKIFHTEDTVDNFKVRNFSNFFVGAEAQYFPAFSKKSKFSLQFCAIGLFTETKASEFRFNYEYSFKNNFSFLIGLFNYTLRGFYEFQATPASDIEKREIVEEYGGLVLGMILGF